ncbi:putative glutathione s [Phaeomoniella chlamydospora]|uniref:Putative glutathione s n=1 Tax=Phaeomoniella chlamydospora TaxID=158046 RepID=A0A0G2E860_PHACM|nr:putative glutathione s [Phaeomoniella chlamydospora]
MKSPRGKLPYIRIHKEDSSDSQLISDSTLITETLVRNGMLNDLNSGLSPVEKAQDAAVRALLEDKLYFYQVDMSISTQVHERWVENYYVMRSNTFAAVPYPMQVVIGLLAYRKMAQSLYGQGTGRFSIEEIKSFRREAWEHINALLNESRRSASDKDAAFWVLGGKQPSEADATLFGFIASANVCLAGPDSMKLVKSFPTVMDYARRIYNNYFPDYAGWH